MRATLYPVHVDARLDSHLSRWLWLVKWVLVIPHYVVLAFLWTAFFLLSAVAMFAILFTGRYPRAIFDFNVGVLRWTWRVGYYAYGALGTDRYPPFSLDEVPDYPAHLSVDYPGHLSRGLVLVKWWLLAIPHYLVVGLLISSGIYLAWGTAEAGDWSWGGGLIALLVLLAAVILAVTGTYPQQLFDLILGLNRWVLRVAAYAGLMTDEYPPFRLDMGGPDPDAARMALPAAGAMTFPGAAGAVGAPGAAGAAGAVGAVQGGVAPRAQGGWSAGSIVAVVLGAIVFLVAGGLIAGGATLGVADRTLRTDDGFLMSRTQTVSSGTYAVASEPLTIDAAGTGEAVPRRLLGEVTLRAHTTDGGPLFVGVAPAAAAATYLAGVEHATLTGFEDADGTTVPVLRETAGAPPQQLPGDARIWAASSTGAGEQRLTWEPEAGGWTVVVMNADGGAGVSADLAVGATAPVVGPLTVALLVAGGLLLVGSIAIALVAVHGRRRL